MSQRNCLNSFSRRQMLSIGITAAGGFAGAMIAGCASPGTGMSGGVPTTVSKNANPEGILVAQTTGLSIVNLSPNLVDEIESIINAKGTIENGLLHIGIDRDDIPNVTLRGVPILPSFEINGDLYFQCLGGNEVILNADLCVKGSETQDFIGELIKHNIAFQAFHQHFYDFSPIVWFVHFRARGDGVQIARGIKAALNVTSTPFPQSPPAHPTTPLPAEELGDILGAKPSIGANGVVSFNVPRDDAIILGGTRISPYLNVATSINFEPYGGGINAAAVPDYGMIATEIQRVVGLQLSRGWDIGCLYNQETDEQPQLFFSHQFKTGNSLQLAREIRAALNLMDMKFESV